MSPQPLGGPLFTRGYLFLLSIVALAGVLMLWRFFVGLGATTGMNDGYPWGLWIAFDVVTGTAFAAGGYGVALLVFVLNRGEFHAFVRPAVVTTALGYTMAGFSIVLDVGRWWNIWKVPLFAGSWNLNSALLEVALCVMAYMAVAWVEVSHPVLEQWERLPTFVHGMARRLHPIVKRSLPFIIALGILLPTMHQSSLGTVFIVSSKLHPLWHSPLLPLLFLVSCLGMGYAGVVIESTLAGLGFHRRPEWTLLARLSHVIAFILLGWVALRVGDLAWRGQLDRVLELDRPAGFFLLELALFVVPGVLLLFQRNRRDRGVLFASAVLAALAGAFYRFNTYLIAYTPSPGWHYFPSVTEILVTVGVVAIEISGYVLIVKRFPILGGAHR